MMSLTWLSGSSYGQGKILIVVIPDSSCSHIIALYYNLFRGTFIVALGTWKDIQHHSRAHILFQSWHMQERIDWV